MSDEFANVYEDKTRADSYADLEFPGTYYLAYRDLPAIIGPTHGVGALDFGCGAGRSTRFLRDLGVASVIGVDIAEEMIGQARERDPEGDYRIVPAGDLSSLPAAGFDLVLSVFTFDNVPTRAKKVEIFRSLKRLLRAGGRVVSLVSAPEIYVNEWASFSTQGFAENRVARSGDEVRIVMLDVEDSRPVVDVLWADSAYRDVYDRSGLKVLKTYRPLGRASESQAWVSETTVPPWTIYELAGAE